VPPLPRDARVQAAWAAHRPYLLAVAGGMLKRQDGAEDVVQEAFARLAASPEAIEDVRGWLVVVTRRLCRTGSTGRRAGGQPRRPNHPNHWRRPGALRTRRTA
jgi:DNA-directed RNA polymerase specialized sigma24 family protein